MDDSTQGRRKEANTARAHKRKKGPQLDIGRKSARRARENRDDEQEKPMETVGKLDSSEASAAWEEGQERSRGQTQV